VYTRNCIESSNLSFTATLSKHKPLIFLEKVGGLWFLVSEKGPNRARSRNPVFKPPPANGVPMEIHGETGVLFGRFNGQQIVPRTVVDEIRHGGDKKAFAQAGYELLKGWNYRSMWWVTDKEGGGIHRARRPRAANLCRSAGRDGHCPLCIPSDCQQLGQRSRYVAGV
jgi:hypothetical protein